MLMEDDFMSLFSDEEDYGSMNEIVKDRLYLGDLFTAMSSKVKSKHRITHIVSVGPDYPSTGPEHLVVSVDDEAHQNLLQHLNTVCQFIQQALDSNGRVLVHCMMGVSRSPTVVAAYLMKTQGMSVSQAIRTIKHQRPQIHPNAGFMEQLDIFAKCNYDTSDTNPVYASWIAEQALLDMSSSRPRKLTLSTIIPEKLFVSSDFLRDPKLVESLGDSGITHVVTLGENIPVFHKDLSQFHEKISEPSEYKADLLLALDGICTFMDDAIKNAGKVLIHCPKESRTCIVASAYLMSRMGMNVIESFDVVEEGLPLFTASHNYILHLDTFERCEYKPTIEHPLVQEWLNSDLGSSWPIADKYKNLLSRRRRQ